MAARQTISELQQTESLNHLAMLLSLLTKAQGGRAALSSVGCIAACASVGLCQVPFTVTRGWCGHFDAWRLDR